MQVKWLVELHNHKAVILVLKLFELSCLMLVCNLTYLRANCHTVFTIDTSHKVAVSHSPIILL